ncbi:hypothetical protein L915_12828 [Phytophthora nicotianae]|uniref:Uncharacterized protein n=1 Tax=Phytophthora nicotianae TaxID=4792 RepID=W2GF58_PHYNI|nr:hypothetical protein L915_12828 [Phytophthora nicotianae]
MRKKTHDLDPLAAKTADQRATSISIPAVVKGPAVYTDSPKNPAQTPLPRSREERIGPPTGTQGEHYNFTEDRSTSSVSRQFGRSVQEDLSDQQFSQNHFATKSVMVKWFHFAAHM